MTLHFKNYPDIPLANSPLVEVICQVQFSPILRIGAEPPARVQDALRGRFPKFGTNHGFAVDASSIAGGEAPTVVRQPVSYRFSKTSESSAVTLAQDFFALSTEAYTVWSDFADDLERVRDAVVAEYDQLDVTRIGLRYVNHLLPDRLGVSEPKGVLSFLAPPLVELLHSERPWSIPISFASQVELEADDGVLAIRLWFDRRSPTPLVLDFDYYQENITSPGDLADLGSRCERFHTAIYNAFRWAIQDDHAGVFQAPGNGASQ